MQGEPAVGRQLQAALGASRGDGVLHHHGHATAAPASAAGGRWFPLTFLQAIGTRAQAFHKVDVVHRLAGGKGIPILQQMLQAVGKRIQPQPVGDGVGVGLVGPGTL